MKKLFCVVLVMLMLAFCLSACSVNKNVSGALAGDSEAAAKVTEMMAALSENRTSDAAELMHPSKKENVDPAITQMYEYLAGRTANNIELININVQNSTGTEGKVRQEQTAYKVTLSDGAVIYSNVIYLSNNAGTGFTSFQLVLGVV